MQPHCWFVREVRLEYPPPAAEKLRASTRKDNLLDALIFDFDGVVVDSEPVHLMGFREVLGMMGLEMTEEDYYARYLGYDDRDCFRAALRDRGVDYTETQIGKLTAAKSKIVRKALTESARPLAGVASLLRSAADANLPVGICSGALRQEIELTLERMALLECFMQIVSAEDVRKGKPDPGGYELALNRLAGTAGRKLHPNRSVAIEDSPAGIDSAKAAGMKVLAVTNSYPSEQLSSADRVVDSLTQVTLTSLEEMQDS